MRHLIISLLLVVSPLSSCAWQDRMLRDLAADRQRWSAPYPTPVPYVAYPSDAQLQMACSEAFSKITATLVGRSTKIASAIKDAGLITTGRIFLPNIDRSNIGLAFSCGMAEGGGNFPYQCLDFSVEYQLLLQPESEGRCHLTVSANVQGLDADHIPRGNISDPTIVNAAIKRFDRAVGPFLAP